MCCVLLARPAYDECSFVISVVSQCLRWLSFDWLTVAVWNYFTFGFVQKLLAVFLQPAKTPRNIFTKRLNELHARCVRRWNVPKMIKYDQMPMPTDNEKLLPLQLQQQQQPVKFGEEENTYISFNCNQSRENVWERRGREGENLQNKHKQIQ